MKMYTLASFLGLAALVYAEAENTVVRSRRRLVEVRSRRRLAEQCSFAPNRAGAKDPNCLGKLTWTVSATKVSSAFALVHHDYRCCTDKHPGWVGATKQLACAEASSVRCADPINTGIKEDDAICRDPKKKDPKVASFYTVGYSHTACTGYADDCRASLSCDVAGGYSGTADLACQGATAGNGDFALKGCGRSDVGVLGSDLTSSVFIVAPHTAPKSDGNPKNSFAECSSLARHYNVKAFVAGNGGCDQDNTCYVPDQCAVFPSWDGVLDTSESEDTFIRPFVFKSKLAESCVTLNPPTALSAAKDCPNAGSQTDAAKYGGFDLYGDRFSCWRNMGGSIKIKKKNTDMQALDLTYEVMTDPVNAGIGKTLLAYATSLDIGVVGTGVWNGGETGIGYGVCDGVDKAFGGCTAELSALMCEAYNKKLVAGGGTDISKFCTGFVLSDAKSGVGAKSVYQGTENGDYDMLVGFFSPAGGDAKYDAGQDKNGGYFKYIAIPDCLSTDITDCSKCEKCKTGKVIDSDGQCVAACPKYQWANGDKCEYCAPHCIECSTDGQTCVKCASTHEPSPDKTSCEETGCKVPATLESLLKDPLVGAINQNSPACVISQNLVPGTKGTCGVDCSAGLYADDPKKTFVYSCPVKGAVVAPTITCKKCTGTKCKTCPSDDCTVCNTGHVLDPAKSTLADGCVPRPCPNTGTAGACTVCPLGSAGTLGWSFTTEDWDTSPCTGCTVSGCLACTGNAAECLTCHSGYYLKDATNCVLIPDCPFGKTGKMEWTGTALDDSKCIAKGPCTDKDQTAGACTDCADGDAGSVDWDYTNQVWVTTQCHTVACPLSSETNCKNCPAFTTGTPVWDDLSNRWEGCLANDFGFSGPSSASWSGSVSADKHVVDTKSAEMLHVANNQYDAIKEEWVCDEGFAGVSCQQRLCPETSAFVSGTDSFTPSLSMGSTWMTDIGTSNSGTFSNQHSYRECSGRGSCDFETGICQCFPGYTGVGCRRTTCPNGCSGHGVCTNDNTVNYRAPGNDFLPSGDRDINTWGNLWAESKFQGCRCDGGWGGHDCSLRQCPRGDDPETTCDEDLGNDLQILECTNLFATKEAYFKIRFTDQLGHRYNTRAIVVPVHATAVIEANHGEVGPAFTKAAAHSIQTALESLPNFAIPKLEVTANPPLPAYGQTNNKNDFTKSFGATFELKFTDPRNAGVLPLMEVESDAKCVSGVQPKYTNTDVPDCTVKRAAKPANVNFRENFECSNRGRCNRKTAECNCFDGYTGLACDTIAQTY